VRQHRDSSIQKGEGRRSDEGHFTSFLDFLTTMYLIFAVLLVCFYLRLYEHHFLYCKSLLFGVMLSQSSALTFGNLTLAASHISFLPPMATSRPCQRTSAFKPSNLL